MKQGWEYKKLGEVVDVINGLWTGKKPPFVTVAVVRNTNFTKECTLDMTNVAYIDVEEKQFATRELQYGDIIIEKSGGSDKQPVGRPVFFNIEEGGYSFSNFTATLRIQDKKLITSKFLHNALIGLYKQGVTRRLQSKTTGIHNLDFKSYLKIPIPLPPLSIQQSIVAELDEINNLLSLKRKELETYDKLAQSLFYEMFGDPVENEKGWEVKKLGEVCEIIAGGDKPNDIKVIRTNDYIYPIIANGEGDKGILGYSNRYRISKPSVTIGARGASIGNCRIVTECFTPVVRLITLTPQENVNVIFLYFYAKGINYNSNGAGQAQLTVPNIKSENFPLPPLPLQQLFAQRIEAIETQKAQVKAAIEKLETLLAARMQYWFE